MKAVHTSVSSRRAINLSRTVPVPAEAARDLLVTDPAAVVGVSSPTVAGTGRRQVGVRLMGNLQLQRQVRLGFGPLIEEDDGIVALPLWWEAAEHPQLFPTFDGGIEVDAQGDATELRLVGSCQPPLGRLGAFTDEIVGYRVVRATLDAFLEELANHLVQRHSQGPGSQ